MPDPTGPMPPREAALTAAAARRDAETKAAYEQRSIAFALAHVDCTAALKEAGDTYRATLAEIDAEFPEVPRA